MNTTSPSDGSDWSIDQSDHQLPDGTPYTVRPFEPTDRPAVRNLYAAVTGTKPAPEWLTWKFELNPARRGHCLYLAVSPDRLLGARPLYPLRMRSGGNTLNATCLVNAMVHPDFQGKGVFSALSSHAIEQVAQRSDLAFLFANNNSRPVYDNWGWIEVTRVLPFFRFQHPTALLPDGGGLTRPVGALLSLGARSYLRARRLLMDDSTSISVVHFDEVPAARLAALYQQAVPDALHVVRDPEYYRWRFGEPNGSWTTYLATRGGRDLGALAVRPRTVNGNLSRVDVSDGLPVGVSGREDVFKALLDRVIADNRSVDLIGDPCGAVPSSVLRDRGFLSADSPPLSWAYARFFDPLTLFVKPLSQLNVDVRDEQNWEIDDLTHNTN